ncbi:unnamed protein product [Lactuca saligna]|uniref:C2H2-type domain-containing protein n=1 Tax=Lactuca saligna TaxID=75948 RepID=A0AA35ZYM6_LACSI|nr:unnamed protein product [Lactuca saligna]
MELNIDDLECIICKKICKDQNTLSDHLSLHVLDTSAEATRAYRNQKRNRSPPRTIDFFPDPLRLKLDPAPQTAPPSLELPLAPKSNQALVEPMNVHQEPKENQKESEVSTTLSLS